MPAFRRIETWPDTSCQTKSQSIQLSIDAKVLLARWLYFRHNLNSIYILESAR
jgi:hypothetical protein